MSSDLNTALGVPTKDSLRRTPFPKLIRHLARARSTGTLYLISGETKKVVFFDEGSPVSVRSNMLSECLGQTMAKDGLITQEQCDRTLEAIRRTGKKQGELLVEMGIVSAGNLRFGLEQQLRYKLFQIFNWKDGRYHFKAGTNSDRTPPISLDLSAADMIISALLEVCSEKQARRSLETVSSRYPVADKKAVKQLKTLVSDQLYYAECLDGSRSVGELLKEKDNTEVPIPSIFIYALIQGGVVKLGKTRRPAQVTPTKADQGQNRPDKDLLPAHQPSSNISEYEDTPLPGVAPTAKEPMALRTSEFEGDSFDKGGERGIDDDLAAAVQDSVDDTFGTDVEFLDEDAIELMDEEATVDLGSGSYVNLESNQESFVGLSPGSSGDLFGLNDEGTNGGISLASLADELEPNASDSNSSKVLDDAADTKNDGIQFDFINLNDDDLDLIEEDEEPKIDGALHYNRGEIALRKGHWADAIEELENAFEHGWDTAELHAMLAYARYQSNGRSQPIAKHALELLDYAENLDPETDRVWIFRAAILKDRGDLEGARNAIQKALDLNPNSEFVQELRQRS